MQVAEALGRTLGRLGVSHLFGLIGSGNFALAQAASEAGVTFVAARQETAAVAMADGYARTLGAGGRAGSGVPAGRRVGLATVHQGPGLTNAMTALAEAAKSRTPLVLVAADVAASDLRSNFRVEAAGLARSVGAVVERLDEPARAPAGLARAVARAVAERRAVVVLAPLDVQLAPWPEAMALDEGEVPGAAPAVSQVDGAEVEQVANLIAGAARPALIAGRGAALAGARRPLEELADAGEALLATSAVANGLFAGNPRSLGISGGFASPDAARLLAQADLLVAFGASLNMWTTKHGGLVGPDTRVVQIDLEEEAIGAHRPVDVGIVADAAEAAAALARALPPRRGPGWASANGFPRARRWADVPYEDASGRGTIDPRTLTIALDRILPAARTVAVDSGHFMGWPAMYLGVPDPAGFVFTQAFQSVGLGLGSGLGAAVARPDRLTVACVGDGGALMALGELESVARLGLPFLVVVYDDAAYGAEVHHFRPLGYPVDLARFGPVDFAGVARALGLQGLTVTREDDLGPLGTWLKEPAGGFLVDAKVTSHVVGEWLEEAFRGH